MTVMTDGISFIPGIFPSDPGLLARFLPPLQTGVVETWLKENIAPGSWILDPFAASPHLIIEAAKAGYRVLVAANNPIIRFYLDILSNPPNPNQIQTALVELADSYRGEDRLEPLIKSLYQSTCVHCGKPLFIEAFIWEKGRNVPSSKIYQCLNCGDTGEHPANVSDTFLAEKFSTHGLHWARALERVVTLDDPDRVYAEEALSAYLPRAVYGLFILINKLDSFPAEQKHILDLIFLTVFDQVNSLWPHPTSRYRPKQITSLNRYRENNLWLALEDAVDYWKIDTENSTNQRLIESTRWPELPNNEGGICIFEGRLKELNKLITEDNQQHISIDAVITAIPRPNQAFWTLSALWAGWLWGKDATESFKSVLRRRRYDWSWHCTALFTGLKSLYQILSSGTPILGLIGETEVNYLTSTLIAAWMANLELKGVALRFDIGLTQILWQKTGSRILQRTGSSQLEDAHNILRESAQEYLQIRGEPVHLIYPLTAAILNLIEKPADEVLPPDFPAHEAISAINNLFQKVFSYQSGFVRYGGGEHSIESGSWWIRQDQLQKDPTNEFGLSLSDQIEIEAVRFFISHPEFTSLELDKNICASRSGLFTPEFELIQECLHSYNESISPVSDLWRLQSVDYPRNRMKNLEEMVKLLEMIGKRLGFLIERIAISDFIETSEENYSNPLSFKPLLIWKDHNENICYTYLVIATGLIGKIIDIFKRSAIASNIGGESALIQKIIVIPGSRASLVRYKMRNDPRLKQEIEAGWQFLKFRHLRRLAEATILTKDNLQSQLTLDPIASTDPQIPLL